MTLEEAKVIADKLDDLCCDNCVARTIRAFNEAFPEVTFLIVRDGAVTAMSSTRH